jgi:hypothetical protein
VHSLRTLINDRHPVPARVVSVTPPVTASDDQRWKSPVSRTTGEARHYRQSVTCRVGAYRWRCSLIHRDGRLSSCAGGPATSPGNAAELISEHLKVHGGDR